ncbi:MAG: SirB1 family protein [Thalassobaculales bacterium]
MTMDPREPPAPPPLDVMKAVAEAGDRDLPIAEAALALAAFERPGVDPAHYHRHLARIAAEMAAAAAPGAEPAEVLAAVMAEGFDYRGDRDSYDDLQNANLMRVIDRRRGLPVALGILYLHAARAAGWRAAGLAFPGHFLIRVEGAGRRVILDPYHDGRRCEAADLRALLGEGRDLDPRHYAEVPDRQVLLRLQNNIKTRQVQAERFEEAANVLETMLLMAPGEPALWREAGLVYARIENYRAAIAALETYVLLSGDDGGRHAVAGLLQRLKGRLN